LRHYASPKFWKCYDKLPGSIQLLAKKNYELLKENPRHSSLHFKKINKYYSIRASLQYRALGIGVDDGILWLWIGSHDAYDKLLG